MFSLRALRGGSGAAGAGAGLRPCRSKEWRLPSLETLLTSGGGERIALDSTGKNRYGCRAYPDSDLAAWGSSTASVISASGYAAAERLYQRLLDRLADTPREEVYDVERERVRREVAVLAGIGDMPGLEVMLNPSGTDAHALASALVRATATEPPVVVTIEPSETGRSVPNALGVPDEFLVGIRVRASDGTPRPTRDIDTEFAGAVERAVRARRRVLLVAVDVSKTGLIAPSPGCVCALAEQWPDTVDVLVDACQFRMSSHTLRSYLEQGFMVAITGSKFVTGPSFSGALLIPASTAHRLQEHSVPNAMKEKRGSSILCARDALMGSTGGAAKFGLLMRWEAALEELRAFRQVPEAAAASFLSRLADSLHHRFATDPSFEPVASPTPDRGVFSRASSWDRIATIHPFMLRHRKELLDATRTAQIHRLLQAEWALPPPLSAGHRGNARYQLGQPVACGQRRGRPIAALRICASARLVVLATQEDGANEGKFIEQAMDALDAVAELSCITSSVDDEGYRAAMSLAAKL